MWSLTLLQVDPGPAWVGPVVAISAAIVALAVLAVAVGGVVLARRVASEVQERKVRLSGMQDDIRETLRSVQQVTAQARELMTLAHDEAGAFARTGRRLRRKLNRGVDRVEGRLLDLEALYDVVHGEVEDSALDFAAALRRVRRGGGMIGRLRRLLVASRR